MRPPEQILASRRAYALFVAITLLNFVVFVGLTLHLGGDAVNGKVESGHYYLWGYNAHTRTKGYTEVSEGVYRYSRLHTYSVLVTWPLMLLGGLVLRRKRHRQTGGLDEVRPA